MPSIRIVSWNVQGRPTITGYTPYTKILPSLSALSGADIIMLQEFIYTPERLQHFKQKGWFVVSPNQAGSPQAKSKNNNVLVSRFPVADMCEIQCGGPRAERCVRSEVCISNEVRVRLYVCHFQIFKSGPRSRLEQLKAICEDAANYPGPVVIAGDLNTTVPMPGLNRSIIKAWHQIPRSELVLPGGALRADERLPFAHLAADYGFVEVFDLERPTWSPLKSSSAEFFKLKLDWFLVRGLLVQSAHMHPYVSDHRALGVTLGVL